MTKSELILSNNQFSLDLLPTIVYLFLLDSEQEIPIVLLQGLFISVSTLNGTIVLNKPLTGVLIVQNAIVPDLFVCKKISSGIQIISRKNGSLLIGRLIASTLTNETAIVSLISIGKLLDNVSVNQSQIETLIVLKISLSGKVNAIAEGISALLLIISLAAELQAISGITAQLNLSKYLASDLSAIAVTGGILNVLVKFATVCSVISGQIGNLFIVKIIESRKNIESKIDTGLSLSKLLNSESYVAISNMVADLTVNTGNSIIPVIISPLL